MSTAHSRPGTAPAGVGRVPLGAGVRSASRLLPAAGSAVLALAAVPAHLAVLTTHGHGPAATLLLTAMALWCARCGLHVLRPRAGATPALRGLLASAAVMVLTHALLVVGLPGATGGHHHGGAAGASAKVGTGSGVGPMLAIVVLELGVALCAALALRRR